MKKKMILGIYDSTKLRRWIYVTTIKRNAFISLDTTKIFAEQIIMGQCKFISIENDTIF